MTSGTKVGSVTHGPTHGMLDRVTGACGQSTQTMQGVPGTFVSSVALAGSATLASRRYEHSRVRTRPTAWPYSAACYSRSDRIELGGCHADVCANGEAMTRRSGVPSAAWPRQTDCGLSDGPDGANPQHRCDASVRRLQSLPSAVAAWSSSVGARARLGPAVQLWVDVYGRTELDLRAHPVARPPTSRISGTEK